jgi:hypothetical protein
VISNDQRERKGEEFPYAVDRVIVELTLEAAFDTKRRYILLNINTSLAP